jgi:small basic protein (TIGR04137 family)
VGLQCSVLPNYCSPGAFGADGGYAGVCRAKQEFFEMTIDKSLRVKSGAISNRNVLTRAERIVKLKESERWKEGDKVLGLPKVRVLKLALKKKKKAKAEEGAEGAAPAAGAAKGAAKGAAPAAKGGAKPAGGKK